MRKLLLAASTVAALALAMPGAHAATIGSTPLGTTNAGNNVIGQTEGWFGANLFLIAGAATTVAIEYLGKEAGFTNIFSLNGTDYVNTSTTANPAAGNGSPPGSPVPPYAFNLINSVLVNPGVINFSFLVTNTGKSVSNTGVNPNPTGSPGYFVTLGSGSYSNVDTLVNGITPGSGQWAIIALDDGGSPDDNHDDLVVRLSLTGGSFAVPEPSTYLLMVSGLLALGFMARRRIG